MSRFFEASSSESDSSSEESLYGDDRVEDSDDQSSSEDDSDNDSDSNSSDSDDGQTGASRFFKDEASDSESEDENKVTVVKSAKDKRLDELEATIRLIENAQKISDWSHISERT